MQMSYVKVHCHVMKKVFLCMHVSMWRMSWKERRYCWLFVGVFVVVVGATSIKAFPVITAPRKLLIGRCWWR